MRDGSASRSRGDAPAVGATGLSVRSQRDLSDLVKTLLVARLARIEPGPIHGKALSRAGDGQWPADCPSWMGACEGPLDDPADLHSILTKSQF